MLGFALRRLIASALTLLVVAAATFALVHAIPGGPFSAERSLPPEVEANLLARYRLNEPPWMQFSRWVGNAVRGDLGPSFTQSDRTVNDIIRDGFPKTAQLGAAAFALALLLGMPAGIVGAMSRRKGGRIRRAKLVSQGGEQPRRPGDASGRWSLRGPSLRVADRALMAGAVVGVSVPSFIIASLLQYGLAYRREWLPPAGWGDTPLQIVMPTLSLAAFPAAFVSRLVRSSLLDALAQDFVRTARAKGLGTLRVVCRHALRNALLPLVTYAAPLLAGLLTGSFVVEDIFAIPGLGRLFVSSINDRDYTVLLGVTVFYAALVIAFNAVADVLYGILDPRIGGPREG